MPHYVIASSVLQSTVQIAGQCCVAQLVDCNKHGGQWSRSMSTMTSSGSVLHSVIHTAELWVDSSSPTEVSFSYKLCLLHRILFSTWLLLLFLRGRLQSSLWLISSCFKILMWDLGVCCGSSPSSRCFILCDTLIVVFEVPCNFWFLWLHLLG